MPRAAAFDLYPKVSPFLASGVAIQTLEPLLLKELSDEGPRKVVLNVPLSIMIRCTRPEMLSGNSLYRWCFTAIHPVVVGFTVYNAKLDEHSERSLQSCLAGVSEDYAEPAIWDGASESTSGLAVSFRLKLSSVELSNEAQRLLVERKKIPYRHPDPVQIWTLPATAVLAANQLLHPLPQEPRAYLAATLSVALEMWESEVPELAKRSQQWSDASKGFTEGLAKSFIDSSLNEKTLRLLTKEIIGNWRRNCVNEHGATAEQSLKVEEALHGFRTFLSSAERDVHSDTDASSSESEASVQSSPLRKRKRRSSSSSFERFVPQNRLKKPKKG